MGPLLQLDLQQVQALTSTQGSFDPTSNMSGISAPRTPIWSPTPQSPRAERDICSDATPRSHSADVDSIHGTDAHYTSPPPRASIDLTPPPTSQIPQSSATLGPSTSFVRREHLPVSPPGSNKIGYTAYPNGLFGEIPSAESVRDLTEEQLRRLVANLLPALSEARMSAAHAKLQHSLLAIENAESIKRAEVEHELTRREVQVLQECSHQQRGGIAMSPVFQQQSSTQRHLDLALKHCRELQADNVDLERKLKRAKKWIMQLDGKNSELMDDIQLLRQRIRQNRDHLNAMRSSGALSVNGSPLPDFSSPVQNRTPKVCRTTPGINGHVGSQDPFDALLFAGRQVLNGDNNSVPSTPSGSKAKKPQSTHMRGAHSLSSLPATPSRSRLITSGSTPSTPANQLIEESRVNLSAQHSPNEKDHREDRDSTISASDNEGEGYRDYNVPASEASQRATNILRRSSSKKGGKVPASVNVRTLRGMKQGTLYGYVKKPGAERQENLQQKRGADAISYDDSLKPNKKAKLADGVHKKVGLGIGTWPSPGP